MQQQRQDAEAKERANREAEKAQKAVSDTQSEAPVVTPTQPVITADEAQASSDTAQQKWEAYRAQQAREAQVRREYEAMKQQAPADNPTKVEPVVNTPTIDTAQAQASSERVNNLLADLHKTSNRIREQLGNTHAREVGRQYGNSVKSNLEGIRAGKSTEAVRQDLRQYLNQVADTLHTSRPDDKAIDEAVRQLEDEANRIHTTPKQEAPSTSAQRIYTPTPSNGTTSNTQALSQGATSNAQTSNGVTSTSGSTVSKNDTTIDTKASSDTSQSANSNTRSEVSTTDTSAETAKKLPPTTSAKELPKTGDTSVVALLGLLSLLGGYGVLPKKRS